MNLYQRMVWCLIMDRFFGDANAPKETKTIEHFVQLYDASFDPWQLSTSWYEKRKYAITIASLPKATYRYCYEPGCAIGELTKLLATRCGNLLAVDAVSAAVIIARNATKKFSNVKVQQAILPFDLPTQTFDLIVLSELLYYFSEKDFMILQKKFN